MADEKNDGVVFEIHADDSSLEGEMNRATQKVKKSAEQTAKAQEKAQKEASEAAKQSSSEQVSHYENAQEKIRRKASDTGDKIVKKHGQDTDKLKQHESEHERASKQSDENRRKHHSDTGDKVVKKHRQDAEQLKKHAAEYEEKAKKTAANVGKAYAAIGTAAVTASVAAITEAAKMETSFAKVKTLLSDKAIVDNYYAEMKAAAKDTGLLFSDLSESVYSAISASVDESKAVDFSKTAVKLAKGGFTSAATAVDVLTTAINAYGLAAEDASHVSDVLITAQNAGKTTVDELAASMGQTIPIANSAGAAIEDLATQYAILTKNGVATSEAGTGIKAMLSELNAAGTDISKTLKELTGKSFSELQAEGKSTADILSVLADYAQSSGKKLSDLFGSVEAGSAALTLVKDGGADFNKILGQMKNSASATEKAYETMSNTLEERFKKLKNKFVLAFSEVGEELMPYAEELTDYVDQHAEEIAGTIKEIGKAAGELTKILGEGVKILWEYKEAVLAAAAAYATYKTAVAVSSVVKSATAAVKGLNLALAANPAGFVVSAISAIVGGLAALIASAKSAREMIDDVAAAAADLAEEAGNATDKAKGLSDIAKKYEEINGSMEESAERTAALEALQKELNQAYGDVSGEIDVVNGKYDEQKEKISGLIDEMDRLARSKAIQAYEKMQKSAELEIQFSINDSSFGNAVLQSKELQKAIRDAAETAADGIYLFDYGEDNLGFNIIGTVEQKYEAYKAIVENMEAAGLDLMSETQGYYAEMVSKMQEYGEKVEQNRVIQENYNRAMGLTTETLETETEVVESSTSAIFRQTEAARENAETAAQQKTAYDELAQSTKDLISQAEGLYAILEKVKNGEALTYDEIQRLIAVYPDLADSISLTADGYVVEKSALDELNAALNNSIQTQLDAEREKTLAAIDGARERIKIYQREAEAIAKAGASADRERLAEIAAAIGAEEKYIDGLAAKLKTDDSAVQYLQNSAAKSSAVKPSGGTGNASGGAKTANTDEYAEKKAELDYRRDMGQIDDARYYEELAALRDQYTQADSAEWRAANVAIHNYEESLKKENAAKSSGTSGSAVPVISIDSYIPTIWDDAEESNRKLAAAVGIERAGHSKSGKIISGLETIEAPQASVSASSGSSMTEAQALAEAARALQSLEKADEKRKISLFLELKARDLMIGTAAYEDINDITKMNGKSPLIGR